MTSRSSMIGSDTDRFLAFSLQPISLLARARGQFQQPSVCLFGQPDAAELARSGMARRAPGTFSVIVRAASDRHAQIVGQPPVALRVGGSMLAVIHLDRVEPARRASRESRNRVRRAPDAPATRCRQQRGATSMTLRTGGPSLGYPRRAALRRARRRTPRAAIARDRPPSSPPRVPGARPPARASHRRAGDGLRSARQPRPAARPSPRFARAAPSRCDARNSLQRGRGRDRRSSRARGRRARRRRR